MKRLAVGLVATLWCSAALGQGIGVFADPLGMDCNLVIPYPGAAVTAYVVGTIDEISGPCAIGASFRIQGLPDGWTATAAAGPDVNIVLGDAFTEGTRVGFYDCLNGRRLLLVLSITASSAVEGATLTIVPHTNPVSQDCGWEGQPCAQPCPFFCDYNGLGYDCQCAASWTTTINGPPCVVGARHSSWGELKEIYR